MTLISFTFHLTKRKAGSINQSMKSLQCNIKEKKLLFKPYLQYRNHPEEISADKILTRKLNAFYFLEAELSKRNKNHVCDFLLEKLPVKS